MEGTAERTVVVRITCGANMTEEDFVGKTVAEIRTGLRESLNIPDTAMPLVDGEQVAENYEIQPRDHLEFVRPSGVKG